MRPHENPILKRLEGVMLYGVLIAAAILATIHGIKKGVDAPTATAFVLILLAVVVFEFSAAKHMAISWFERRVGGIVGWALVWGSCVVGSLWVNFATSAGTQDINSSTQKASYVKFENASDQLAAAKAERTRIEKRLEWMQGAVNGKPVRTPEAAQADIQKSMAHRFWEMTEGCTKTMGPQTRSFCGDYAAFVAEKALAGEKLVLQSELAEAKASIKEYEALAANGTAVISADQPHLIALANVTGVSMPVAKQIDAMSIPIIAQIIVSMAAILKVVDGYGGQPRQPWLRWGRIMQVVRGDESAPTTAAPAVTTTALVPRTEVRHTYQTQLDPRFDATRAALDNAIGQLKHA